jgi:hypothetical protein
MKRLLFLALLASAAPARAQSTADLYHEAAGLYVGGERDAAEAAAVRGLQRAPDDPKLQALLDRIRQDEQEQSDQGSQQNQQQNPNQQGDEQGQQGGEGERQQDQDGTNRPDDERGGASSGRPEEEQPEAQQSETPQPGREDGLPPSENAPRPGEGEATPESAMPVAPGEMTRAEAERILNAVGAEERLLIRRAQRRPGSGRHVEKDW